MVVFLQSMGPMKMIMEEPLVVTASMEDVGLRYDQFLSKKLPQFSRSCIGMHIKNGAITVNSKTFKASKIVLGTEKFHLLIPPRQASSLVPEDIPLAILFSDDHLAIINKPAGLVTHPGAGVKDGTLCNALIHLFPDLAIGNVERPGIVHRLDKETSGIMVVAKTEIAHRALSDDFKNRRITKIYRAFCFGEFDAKSFELKTGHVRHPHHRLRFFTGLSEVNVPSAHVRSAHTSFSEIVNRYGMSSVKATLHTGRTHQIRAHLADIDHPLLGDKLYGGKRALPNKTPEELKTLVQQLNGQALHAESLSFTHPVTREVMEFFAPLPEHLANIHEYFH